MEYFNLPLTSQSQPGHTADGDSIESLDNSSSGSLKPKEQGQLTRTPVGTPLEHPGAISVSTAFHPSLAPNGVLPDLILVSADGVHFYVHRAHIQAVSSNGLQGLLYSGLSGGEDAASSGLSATAIPIPLPSEVLNVVLHTMYGMSCLHYFPSLEVVDASLSALALYGVALQPLSVPNQPVYQLLLSFAPYRPIYAYALAARHALEDTAVAISSHLLAYPLTQIPDDMAEKMGPLYLKRLFVLHHTRHTALRDILFRPPVPHPPSPECSPEMQQQLTRAWALAAAQLAWDVLPSVSTGALRSILEPLGLKISCPLCAAALRQRVQEVVYEWASVRVSENTPWYDDLWEDLQCTTENNIDCLVAPTLVHNLLYMYLFRAARLLWTSM
ncbi:hypothetical protein C8Q77DRAFT_83216 [Trametes polyzona]|nr:hypothetical protein C8Q77DRAFT_83216 [Trametes polyzona]